MTSTLKRVSFQLTTTSAPRLHLTLAFCKELPHTHPALEIDGWLDTWVIGKALVGVGPRGNIQALAVAFEDDRDLRDVIDFRQSLDGFIDKTFGGFFPHMTMQGDIIANVNDLILMDGFRVKHSEGILR